MDISGKVAATLNEPVTEVVNASREQRRWHCANQRASRPDGKNNAASTEESAAATEELHAEAKVMKQLVAGLLQLVGGQSESGAKKSTIHVRRPQDSHALKINAALRPMAGETATLHR